MTLIGSSLGGTLAILAAARFAARIDRLVLLAPAVMFAKPGHHLLPPERVAEWRRRGALPFFHYAHGAERPLNVSFYEDSLQYDPFHAAFTQPALVFQGLRDTSVDPRTVELFARARPNVTLSLLDDDHQLIASLPRIWNDMRAVSGADRLTLIVSFAGSSVPLWWSRLGSRAWRLPAAGSSFASASRARAAATPSRRCRSKPTSRACSPAKRRATAGRPRSRRSRSPIRTFALANRGRHRADGFDLCDQTHCQVVRTATAATERAAQATAGRVLLRDGAPASVYYSASCGGRTEIPSDVWPGAEDPPYLPSQADDACGGAPAWTADITPRPISCARSTPPASAAIACAASASSRNASGRVARLKLDGLTPDEISGQDLRVAVGRTLGWQHIKSTAFDLKRMPGRVIASPAMAPATAWACA